MMSKRHKYSRPRHKTRRKYSVLVTGLKLFLPAMAVVLVIAMWALPRLTSQEHEVPQITVPIDQLEKTEIENPKYYGFDDSDQPFSVQAKQATVSSIDDNIIDMISPQAEITLENGSWIAAKAGFGRYDKGKKLLFLSDTVVINHDRGYEFRTHEAVVDLLKKNAWGDQQVIGQGPFGEINAEGFHFSSDGEKLVFKGAANLLTSK